MANTNRRYIDSNGNQFMPMNLEGGVWEDNFINTNKLVILGGVIITLVIIILASADSKISLRATIVYTVIWAIVSSLLIRYIVFEEKFYYRMYKQLRGSEITTPAIFWNIASINNTYDGAILTYNDSRVGIIVRLERDTITGKNENFKEVHYDAISEFYRELCKRKYKFIQMNIMEKAGNDPRLENLDPLVHKNDNANICKLMEKEIGYIKGMTHNTLYESDYILVYIDDLSKTNNIVEDTIDCLYLLMDGAYIGYSILNSKDIVELVKELYGVKYFDYTKATMDMYKYNGTTVGKAFDIIALEYEDGKVQELEKAQRNVINKMTSDIISGALNYKDVSFRETLNKNKNIKNNNGVDLNRIERGEFGQPQRDIRNNKYNSFNKNLNSQQNRTQNKFVKNQNDLSIKVEDITFDDPNNYFGNFDDTEIDL